MDVERKCSKSEGYISMKDIEVQVNPCLIIPRTISHCFIICRFPSQTREHAQSTRVVVMAITDCPRLLFISLWEQLVPTWAKQRYASHGSRICTYCVMPLLLFSLFLVARARSFFRKYQKKKLPSKSTKLLPARVRSHSPLLASCMTRRLKTQKPTRIKVEPLSGGGIDDENSEGKLF